MRRRKLCKFDRIICAEDDRPREFYENPFICLSCCSHCKKKGLLIMFSIFHLHSERDKETCGGRSTKDMEDNWEKETAERFE